MTTERRSGHLPAPGARRGVSLAVVLVLLAMIALLALSLTSAHMGTQRLLERRYDGRQADYLARAGVELALAELLAGRDPEFRQTYRPMLGASVDVVVTAQPDKVDHVRIQSAAVYPASGLRRAGREIRRVYRIVRDRSGAPRECVFVSGGRLRQPQFVRADDPRKRPDEELRRAEELAFLRRALRRQATAAAPGAGATANPQGVSGGALGGPRIVPLLIELLEDEDPAVRAGAAQALGHFGPAARPAVPLLTKALNDDDPDVRRAAGELLKQIRAVGKRPDGEQ